MNRTQSAIAGLKMDGGGCVMEHRVAPADRQQGNGDRHLNELGSGLKILKNSKEICIHLDLSNNHDTSLHLKRMASFYHDHGFLPFPHIIISSNSHVPSFICVFYLFRISHNFGISWKGTSSFSFGFSKVTRSEEEG